MSDSLRIAAAFVVLAIGIYLVVATTGVQQVLGGAQALVGACMAYAAIKRRADQQ